MKGYQCHAITDVNMQSGQTSVMLAVAWCVSELLVVKFGFNRHYEIEHFNVAENTYAQCNVLSFPNNMGMHRLEEVLQKPTYHRYPRPKCF